MRYIDELSNDARRNVVKVEFPHYFKETDDNYADNVPYESTEALIRIEESGRVTTATRTREECGRRRDPTLGWEIETEIVEPAYLARYLDRSGWGVRLDATAEAFEAHLAEARAWMGI